MTDYIKLTNNNGSTIEDIRFDFGRVTGNRLDRLDETLIPGIEALATRFAQLVDDEDIIAWAAETQGRDGKQSAAMHRSNKADDIRGHLENALTAARELRSMYLRGGA